MTVGGNATGNSVNRSTRMFYPNENNGRDRYEAPGNWRRRLMKTKREAEAEGPGERAVGRGSLNSREKRGSRVAHDTHTRAYTHTHIHTYTLDDGRYANLISRKWTSGGGAARIRVRACAATLMHERSWRRRGE